MVLCIWCPSTYIALKGRDGHRYSHAPQPMQRSVFMTGIRNESLSPGSMATICIAPAGQWRAQLPQCTLSVITTQFFLIHTACPICMADLSARVIRCTAPAGQTSEHFVHSGRQYPCSYDIWGCMNVSNDAEGRNTLLGHAETHSWQPVQ